ncbi:metallophosphoesterase [Bradyrhizobium sp. SZCCHNR1098]|uniref:metallophosphoesterase n=1 Tax=Bradyrhizobium sp. SZCCHNR1098 TaxID=3057370 RepID=UPI002915F731|nr:metallophosphoesterase [Bradyrhizobium sp. SZCCHNR1098]
MADIKPIEALPGVDVVVVAGDVCEGVVNGFARLREIVAEGVPIIMVMGNHEYYHRTLPTELKLARAEAARFGVDLLENDAVVLGGVRFAGATLWTDYAIFGLGSEVHTMAVCRDRMNDHRRITLAQAALAAVSAAGGARPAPTSMFVFGETEALEPCPNIIPRSCTIPGFHGGPEPSPTRRSLLRTQRRRRFVHAYGNRFDGGSVRRFAGVRRRDRRKFARRVEEGARSTDAA